MSTGKKTWLRAACLALCLLLALETPAQAMRIQHNIAAMNSYRDFGNNSKKLAKNLDKLSSGYRINRAGDDAAGLAVSEKMRQQISGLDAAQTKAKDGIGLMQTAEGALVEVHNSTFP